MLQLGPHCLGKQTEMNISIRRAPWVPICGGGLAYFQAHIQTPLHTPMNTKTTRDSRIIHLPSNHKCQNYQICLSAPFQWIIVQDSLHKDRFALEQAEFCVADAFIFVKMGAGSVQVWPHARKQHSRGSRGRFSALMSSPESLLLSQQRALT